MSANDRQPGGDHYRSVPGGEQHWDRQWRLRGRGWFVGNITKYAERYDSAKGEGLLDLEKLLHYVEKLLELERAAADGTGPPPGGAKPLSGEKEPKTFKELAETLLKEKEGSAGVACHGAAKVDPVLLKEMAEAVRGQKLEVLTPHPSHDWMGGKSTLCKRCGAFSNLPSGTRPCVGYSHHEDRAALERKVAELTGEVARLKAGKFTEEELQALCHEQGEDCPERFAKGCVEYNRKLFGDRSLLQLSPQEKKEPYQ